MGQRFVIADLDRRPPLLHLGRDGKAPLQIGVTGTKDRELIVGGDHFGQTREEEIETLLRR